MAPTTSISLDILEDTVDNSIVLLFFPDRGQAMHDRRNARIQRQTVLLRMFAKRFSEVYLLTKVLYSCQSCARKIMLRCF